MSVNKSCLAVALKNARVNGVPSFFYSRELSILELLVFDRLKPLNDITKMTRMNGSTMMLTHALLLETGSSALIKSCVLWSNVYLLKIETTIQISLITTKFFIRAGLYSRFARKGFYPCTKSMTVNSLDRVVVD